MHVSFKLPYRNNLIMVELDLYVCSLTGGTDVDVPTEEPKCLVCLCCNTVYMAIPFKIRLAYNIVK
jgi:hypothetical protein